jgi:hypothetical protein
MVELMQDAVKMPSSFIPLLLQFHRTLVTFCASYIQYEVEQVLFWVQLGQSLGNVVWFPNGPHMTNDDGDHKLHQLLKLNQIEIGQGFEQNWRGSHGQSPTPMLGSTNCPPPSSNFVDVKNSQMLTL